MKPTLLIIAAGMGSRYGGLKQIDPVGPNGEIIIDYSMYDAIRAGFKKIVFVIRHHFEDAFKEKISGKISGLVETAYAYQELDSCMNGRQVPANREKPWGTGHAILSASGLVNEPFAVINADDFYGPGVYGILKDHLVKNASSADMNYAMVGYELGKTLSEHGTVARGLCRCDEYSYLKSVTEITKIRKNQTGAVYIDSAGQEQHLMPSEIVSMNLWGFMPDLFGHLQQQFFEFLENSNDPKAEFYIPSAVDRLVAQGKKKVKVLRTGEQWFGVTYREDMPRARASVKSLIEQNIYPEKLWQ